MSAVYQVDKFVDAKGQVCPMPVLMLAKAIRTLTTGQVLCITATDPGSKADIPAWSEKTGNVLLEYYDDDNVFTYYIRKA